MATGMKVTGLQAVQRALQKEIDKLRASHYALVGIHESAKKPKGATMTMATLGAIQHFGADIDHPGGTRYVVGQDGKSRFVRNDFVGPVTGVTKSHKITIPARPWLDVGVKSATKELIETVREGIEDGMDSKRIMSRVGETAARAAEDYMIKLKTPPNAPSTIKRKGSDNPLVDSGNLHQSITSSVVRKRPKEGIE